MEKRLICCKDCAYYSPRVMVYPETDIYFQITTVMEAGECRYNPPVSVVGQDRNFPMTGMNDWCGKFSRGIDSMSRCHTIYMEKHPEDRYKDEE